VLSLTTSTAGRGSTASVAISRELAVYVA